MDIVSKSLKALEFDKVLEKLSNFAKTPQSRELCLNAKIFDTAEKIKSQLEFTKEAKKFWTRRLIFRSNLLRILKESKKIHFQVI